MRQLVFVVLALCGLCVSTMQAGPQAAQKVTIYVGPQIRDGFVDVDGRVVDSIEDIKSELEGHKTVQLVADKDRAQIVLEVLSRGATSAAFAGTAALPIGMLSTLLRVGTYEKPIEFQNCRVWRVCARLVVKDVETWLDANAAIITGRTPAGAASDATEPPAVLPSPTRVQQHETCEHTAAKIAAASGATLAQKIRALQPASYAKFTDEKLEELYRHAFPCLPK